MRWGQTHPSSAETSVFATYSKEDIMTHNNNEFIELQALHALEQQFKQAGHVQLTFDVGGIISTLCYLEKALNDPHGNKGTFEGLYQMASVRNRWPDWAPWMLTRDPDLVYDIYAHIIEGLPFRLEVMVRDAGEDGVDVNVEETVLPLVATALEYLLTGKHDVLGGMIRRLDDRIATVLVELTKLTRKLSREIAQLRRLNLEVTTWIYIHKDDGELSHLREKNGLVHELERLRALRTLLLAE